jgi:hypothetical protein
MDRPTQKDVDEYIRLGAELAEHFREAVPKRFPDVSLGDYIAVSGVLVTKLLCSSFTALAKAAGPKAAEEWFTSVLADFAGGTEKALAEEGLPVKIGIDTISVLRKTNVQPEEPYG